MKSNTLAPQASQTNEEKIAQLRATIDESIAAKKAIADQIQNLNQSIADANNRAQIAAQQISEIQRQIEQEQLEAQQSDDERHWRSLSEEVNQSVAHLESLLDRWVTEAKSYEISHRSKPGVWCSLHYAYNTGDLPKIVHQLGRRDFHLAKKSAIRG